MTPRIDMNVWIYHIIPHMRLGISAIKTMRTINVKFREKIDEYIYMLSIKIQEENYKQNDYSREILKVDVSDMTLENAEDASADIVLLALVAFNRVSKNISKSGYSNENLFLYGFVSHLFGKMSGLKMKRGNPLADLRNLVFRGLWFASGEPLEMKKKWIQLVIKKIYDTREGEKEGEYKKEKDKTVIWLQKALFNVMEQNSLIES